APRRCTPPPDRWAATGSWRRAPLPNITFAVAAVIPPRPELARAGELVAAARRGVVFTGAGVSADSGIRTFRGQNGLWRQYGPYKVASIAGFREDPSTYWRVASESWRMFRQAEPNPGHRAIAGLEADGHVAGVVTQNTDGLHRDAGTRTLIELHGNG